MNTQKYHITPETNAYLLNGLDDQPFVDGVTVFNTTKYYRHTIEYFIDRAILLHGNKYIYSKDICLRRGSLVRILCPVHGYFWQRLSAHINPKKPANCMLCSRDKKQVKKDIFLIKCNEKHGDKYDYSKVDFVNFTTPVIIVCPKHGEFKQSPNGHIKGWGCSRCSYDLAGDKVAAVLTKTTSEFIESAIKVHGDKYDYSLVDYINGKSKIKIICPKHGIFIQRASSHLEGRGCRKCISSMGEDRIRRVLEKFNITSTEQCSCNKNKFRRLKFDFYLPYYNILIEYNGQQHYSQDFFDQWPFSNMSLIRQIKHDRLKHWYCQFNNIKLLVIPYWEKDIEGILKKELGL